MKILKRFEDITPIHIAIICQNCWIRFAHFCQGLLAGIAVFHLFATSHVDYWINLKFYKEHLEHFCKFYDTAFSLFLVIAIVYVCDSYDLGHVDMPHLYYFWINRGQFTILLMYMISMILFFKQVPCYNIPFIGKNQILKLLYETTWYDILVIIAWIFDATMVRDNLLLTHLRNILTECDYAKGQIP